MSKCTDAESITEADLLDSISVIRKFLESKDSSHYVEKRVIGTTSDFKAQMAELRDSSLTDEEVKLHISMIKAIVSEVNVHTEAQVGKSIPVLSADLGYSVEACLVHCITAGNNALDKVSNSLIVRK